MSYFTRAVSEWSNPPVDDVGYIPSKQMLAMSDEELTALVEEMERVRYMGWRNHDNKWRETLGLDTTEGLTILDFGCGLGIESLQFAAKNKIILTDISPYNVALAIRVLQLRGFYPEQRPIHETDPYVPRLFEPVDVFYANGVIHHIPYADDVMRWASTVAPEARVMLYSDRGWANHVGLPVPEGRAQDDPRFQQFVRAFDQVGEFAEFYTAERIEERWGQWWELQSFDYICNDDRYCTAILRSRT